MTKTKFCVIPSIDQLLRTQYGLLYQEQHYLDQGLFGRLRPFFELGHKEEVLRFD